MIDYSALLTETKFKAFYDKKEIGTVYAFSEEDAISRINKKFGETVEFDHRDIGRFEIFKA